MCVYIALIKLMFYIDRLECHVMPALISDFLDCFLLNGIRYLSNREEKDMREKKIEPSEKDQRLYYFIYTFSCFILLVTW